MNTKTITVAAIERPQAGKKMGAVIDSTGQRWGVWPDKLPGYQEFKTYEIGYKSNDFKGKTYYTIETATPLNGGRVTGLIIPKTVPPKQEESFDDKRRMDIFVCGAFNNIMANPNVNHLTMTNAEMVGIVNGLKQVWKLTLGPQAQAVLPRGASDTELNDEIPFR